MSPAKKTKKVTPKISPKTLPPKSTPKDVFLHLLMMVMLYIVVIGMIALSFAYVDYWYPDLLNYYPEATLDTIRRSSAMLVVSFPLLILLAWMLQKDLKKQPEKHKLSFGKWLVYITLFVAAITIVIDLIQLVNRFYSGDLTPPFIIKAVSVLVLASAVFSYYVWDVNHEPHKSKVPMTVGWIASFVAVGVLALGFWMAGSPMKQREIRMDERRVSDLQTLQGRVVNYWHYKDTLPAVLDDLKDNIIGFVPPRDPATDAPYSYSVLSPLSFRLCATFSFPSRFSRASYPPAPMIKGGYTDPAGQIWSHSAGETCFERTIDPALYPKPPR